MNDQVYHILEIESLINYIDELYGDQIPSYYSVKRDRWNEESHKRIAIESIKTKLKESPPWETPMETISYMLDEAATNFSIAVSRHKKDVKRLETIYYVINDIYCFVYETTRSPEDE